MRGKRLLTLVTIVALSLSLASGTAMAAPDDSTAPGDEVSTDGADLINMNVDADLGDGDDVDTNHGADLINENLDAGLGDGDDVDTNHGADLINE